MGGSTEQGQRSDKVIRFEDTRRVPLFEECAALHHKRCFFSSCYSASNDALYVCGGNNGDADIPHCERLPHASAKQPEEWQRLPPLHYARNGSACVLNPARNSLMVGGGAQQALGTLAIIEELDLETGS